MIHPGFPRSRSYNPRSFCQITKLLLLTSGISQPVPRYNGELWALHSGPIPIPIQTPVTLHLNTLNLRKIPTLKAKKIPGAVPTNYSTIMGKIPNYLQTRCLNYVLTTRYLKLQNQQGKYRELVLHRGKWVSAGKRSSRASFAIEEGEIQVILGIPGQLRNSRSSTILVYTRGIDICWANQVFNIFLPGFVIWIPLFIAGHR